jgi:hypothetical protein
LVIDFFVILKYLYLNKNTKKKTMKKIVKLTEADLTRLVKRTINEMDYMDDEMEDQDDDMTYGIIETWKQEINYHLERVAGKYIEKLETMLDSMESSSKFNKQQKTDINYEVGTLIRQLQDLQIN